MFPSSEYLFSLFTRHICNLLLFTSCKCNERNAKKIYISKILHERALCARADDDIVQEVAAMVRENYRELGECTAALERVIDALSAELAKPLTPCSEQRCALEQCYNSHTQEPLKCLHLVMEFQQCARNYALSKHE